VVVQATAAVHDPPVIGDDGGMSTTEPDGAQVGSGSPQVGTGGPQVSTDQGIGVPPRGRSRGTARDLAISMSVLIIPIVAFVAFCQPRSSDAPEVDASRVYATATAQRAFPVVEPTGLSGWKATVANFNSEGADRYTLRVSYLLPGGRYLQLLQSNAAAETVVADVVDDGQPLGTEQLSGASWFRYSARGGHEVAFVRLEQQVTVVVVGDASAAKARELIAALH
jgi:hypothetical protein